jgi:hypothetical protein
LLYANRVHRQLVKSTIRIHRGECTKAWDVVQAKSDDDLRKVLIYLRFYVWCFFLGGGNLVYPFLRRILRPYKSLIMRLRSIPVRAVRWTAKATLGVFVDDPRQFVANSVQRAMFWRDRFKRLVTQPRQTLTRLALKIQGRSNTLPHPAITDTASTATGSARLVRRVGHVESSDSARFDSGQPQAPSRDVRRPVSVKP